MSIDKIRKTQASIAELTRDLGALVKGHAEDEGVRTRVDARRAELAEVEQQLARTKAAAAEADAEHAHWLKMTGEVRLKTNAEIDQLQKQLEALQAALAEKRAEHNNILGGIQALHARLKVG